MTTVYPISSAQPKASTSPTDPTGTTSGSNQLNENTFLTLLVAQLKYQDPMNPADSTQFLTQTAQFTEVETLQKMAKQQEAQQAASQVLAASTMIGRPVTYSLTANGGSGTPTPTTVLSVRGSLPTDAAVGAKATANTDVYTEDGVRVPLELDFTKTATGWSVQASHNGAKLGSPVAITFSDSKAIGYFTSGLATVEFPSRRTSIDIQLSRGVRHPAVIPEHVQAVFAAVVEHRVRQRDSGPAAATRLLEAVPVP